MTDTRTDDVAPAPRKSAGAFDIRNIIGALLGIYGAVLTLARLFADPETSKTGGPNANLWAGIAMLVVGIAFIAWARLRPLAVPEHVEPVADDPVKPAPRRKPKN
ncbi:hypothetical protein ACMYYO_13795 [Dermacoccaceae bacterium W4C1]